MNTSVFETVVEHPFEDNNIKISINDDLFVLGGPRNEDLKQYGSFNPSLMRVLRILPFPGSLEYAPSFEILTESLLENV